MTADPGVTPDPSTPDPAPGVGDPSATAPASTDTTITQLADAITDTSGSTGPDTRPSDGAVLRYGKVTAIGTGATAGSVQTDATGAAWVMYDAGYAPALNDLVYLLQQGPVSHVGGKLGGTQPTPPPVGVIVAFSGAAAPTGWVMCQGQALSRTTYAALYAVCGTTYGAGDGSTTFNVPNLVDRIPAGYGTKFLRGETGGSETFTLTTSNLPSHSHTINHDHVNDAHSHTATHDHTGVAMGAHDHPGTALAGHTHSTNLRTSASQAVTGGSASFVNTTAASTEIQTSSVSGGTPNTSSASAGTPNVATYTGNTGNTTNNTQTYSGSSGSSGSGSSVNNMPPYTTVNYILRALP